MFSPASHILPSTFWYFSWWPDTAPTPREDLMVRYLLVPRKFLVVSLVRYLLVIKDCPVVPWFPGCFRYSPDFLRYCPPLTRRYCGLMTRYLLVPRDFLFCLLVIWETENLVVSWWKYLLYSYGEISLGTKSFSFGLLFIWDTGGAPRGNLGVSWWKYPLWS